VGYLQNLRADIRERLVSLKAEGVRNRSRPDFLWYFLLTSFSTMGNSRGYVGLKSDPDNLRRLSFDVLIAHGPEARQEVIESVFRKAKIRMPAQKARWLVKNLLVIQSMGGLTNANAAAFSQPGRDGKIGFLKQFAGIGDKYARNIWMDVYDPDFHNSIAIDQRIKNVSVALGVSFASYEDHERFYQSLAADAGLEPWELDRVLYWNIDEVLATIAGE
jgi:hypothetical protein